MPHYCIEYKPNEFVEVGEETKPPLPMRIVEAKNEARALAHVVEDSMIVRRAQPQDYMALSRIGGEIEKAKDK